MSEWKTLKSTSTIAIQATLPPNLLGVVAEWREERLPVVKAGVGDCDAMLFRHSEQSEISFDKQLRALSRFLAFSSLYIL